MRQFRFPCSPAGKGESPVRGIIRRAIIIGNGFAGAENQCIGLIRALGLGSRYAIHRVVRPRGGVNKWLHWLPISVHKRVVSIFRRIDGNSHGEVVCGRKVVPLSSEFTDVPADAKQIASMARDSFDREGPLLVVASGRDTIPVASSIKLLAPDHVFVVQIQHPRSQLNKFDLVIAPHHDYYPLTAEAQKQIPFFIRRWVTPREPPDRHVILTVGALHKADSAALKTAADMWHAELVPLPKPLLVVNIGGPTSHCKYGVDLAKQLVDKLNKVLWSCGSIRISFSRRTPAKVSEILWQEFSNNPKVCIWDSKGPNPHMGHLALADAFVVTADSVSMLSEACSTGKPVYVIGGERCTWKFADFQKRLQERGAIRPFTGQEDISENWSYTPLNDSAEAASRVLEALAERGWTI